jgi:hypothetical protein
MPPADPLDPWDPGAYYKLRGSTVPGIVNPAEASENGRAIRGGSFRTGVGNGWNDARVFYRMWEYRDHADPATATFFDDLGFRLVRRYP